MYIATHSVMNSQSYPRISPEFMLFMTVWANAETINYNDEWPDTTSYLAGVTAMKVDKNMACTDPTDRRILIIPDGDTSLVIFERFPAGGEYLFVRAPKNGRAIAGTFRTDRRDLAEIIDRLECEIRERRIMSGHRYS